MVSVRATLETTVSTTTSALKHLGWWLDWHARARPTDGCRGSD